MSKDNKVKPNNYVHKHAYKFNSCKVFVDRKRVKKLGYLKHKKNDILRQIDNE